MKLREVIDRVTAWALQRTAVRAYLRYSERRGSMLADSVTYRALFSVFAGVLLGFSVAALWLSGNPEAWKALIDAVDRAIPGLIGGVIPEDSLARPVGLSLAGILSLVGLVGAAIGAIGSLRTAIRTIFDQVTDDLAFYWVMLRNLGLAVGAALALGLSAAATVLGTAGLGIVAGWLGVEESSALVGWASRWVAILVTFLLDAVAIAALVRVLSGIRIPAKALWIGAGVGAVGLTVLQQLSGLFVGGATSNPLLATFASLIALLLWFNLSAQVILISASLIFTMTEQSHDRVHTRFAASTLAQRRVRQAENAVRIATTELQAARDAERDA